MIICNHNFFLLFFLFLYYFLMNMDIRLINNELNSKLIKTTFQTYHYWIGFQTLVSLVWIEKLKTQ